MTVFASVVRDLGDPRLGEPLPRFYAACGIADEWCDAAWQYPEPVYPHPFPPLAELPAGASWEPPPLPRRVPGAHGRMRSRGLAVWSR